MLGAPMGILADFGIPVVNGDVGTARLSLKTRLVRDYFEHVSEKAREKEMQERLDLYKDGPGGLTLAEKVIDEFFADNEVRRLRKAVLRRARFDNALRRIVNENSAVYGVGPERRLASDADTARYRDLARFLRQDAVLRRANQWMNLGNDCLLWFRVRQIGDRPPEPVLEVYFQSQFWAIGHPEDRTACIGTIRKIAGPDTPKHEPHYAVDTSAERFRMNGDHLIIESTWEPQPFSRIPGILIHKTPPDTTLLDGTTGGDLKDAHLMAWVQNTMLIKESKSLSRQAVWTGDPRSIPSGQAQEGEVDLVAGEGIGVQTIDRGIDIDQFMRAADHIIERAAANHGIPPSVLRHQAVTSGFEIELRERRLRENRRDQIGIFRDVERELVELEAEVTAVAAPEWAFNSTGLTVDYPEVQTPISPAEHNDTFEVERRLGLTTTVDEILRRNPDLSSRKEARDVLIGNIAEETVRNIAMRPMVKASGSSNASMPEEPEETHGGDGAMPDVEGDDMMADGDEKAMAKRNGRRGGRMQPAMRGNGGMKQ